MKLYKLISINVFLVFSYTVFGQLELDHALSFSEDNSLISVQGSVRWSGQDFEAYLGNEWISLTDGRAIIDTITDIDNNQYRVMYVGEKRWMLDNLKASRFNDGTSIAFTNDNTEWQNLDGFNAPTACWYDNDFNNIDIHGALYNGHVTNVVSNMGKNICPSGWHVPSKSEFDNLISYFDGSDVAGASLKLKGTDFWESPNDNSNNNSGFSAKASGIRTPSSFGGLLSQTLFWTSDSSGASQIAKFLISGDESVLEVPSATAFGFSIRCIED